MRLYAWDAGSLAGWLYHAEDEPTPTGMIDAIREYLCRWIAEYQPTHAALCLDSGRSFRRDLEPEYKAARRVQPPKPHYREQLAMLPALAAELGIAAVSVDGMEADDVIASLVARHAGPECEAIVCSSDKDLCALVGDHVRVFDPRPNKAGVSRFYDAAGVVDRLGVPPDRVEDLLCLLGDASDGVPGVPGFGKVRALTAIQQAPTLDAAIEMAQRGALASLSGKLQSTLAESAATIAHARSLIRLRRDAAVPSLDDLRVVRGVEHTHTTEDTVQW